MACRWQDYLIITMLNDLGLRAGELLAIKVTDIDFQAQEIVIERRHHDHEEPRCDLCRKAGFGI